MAIMLFMLMMMMMMMMMMMCNGFVAGFADPPTADYLEYKLKKGNVPYEFIRWDTGHSFMNEVVHAHHTNT